MHLRGIAPYVTSQPNMCTGTYPSIVLRPYSEATAFVVPDQFVTILDGSDEGAYGWIAVNYLLAKVCALGRST